MNHKSSNPILLCSLGTSWAVVAEAFFKIGPGANGFKEVHVITSSGRPTDLPIQKVRDFFATYPEVLLTISRVKDFDDLRSESDHFRFEEVLYRWVLQHRLKGNLHFCLAGGFKTMSATMQKAAALFGAAEVFHVLVNDKNKIETIEQVLQVAWDCNIHYIALGSESGWPQFSKENASEFPLIEVPDSSGNLILSAPEDSLRRRVSEIVARSHHIAASWETIANLPFSSLAAKSPEQLVWLESPLQNPEDHGWVKQLPKVELHCHLGGFATHGDLLQQVRAAATSVLPPVAIPEFPNEWPTPRETVSLDHYMKLGDATGSKLLKDSGCLKRQCELLYDALMEDHILYAEIRCSPNNYVTESRSAWMVLSEIRETFDHCMKAAQSRDATHFCQLNLIVIATRKNTGDRSDISRHLSLAITASQHWTEGVRVVGVDLAGFESRESRAELFETDFEAVHRVGLAVTAHAGENDDAEGIWQAVFKLNTRRLGHALHLKQSPDLLRSVADRGIGIEMCPFANCQIKGFHPMKDKLEVYPLLDYLKAGCRVSVNTDNMGISRASLTDNILYLAKLLPEMSRMSILQLERNALETAFISAVDRNLLVKRYENVLMGRGC